MIGSADIADGKDQPAAFPAKFNERTGRAILIRVGWYVAVGCLGELAFAIGYGWSAWILAYYPLLWLVGWLSNTLSLTEWSVDGRELSRRRWFCRPGSVPSAVIELGPRVECVHVAWSRWRIWPGGYAIDVPPWQASRLVEALASAGVRVDDWRGDWSRRHRLVQAIGMLAYCGGAVGVFAAIALAPLRPASAYGLAAIGTAVGAFCVGLAIDFLPWTLRKPKAGNS